MNQTSTKPVEHTEGYMRHSTGDSILFMAIDITWHTHILLIEQYFKDIEIYLSLSPLFAKSLRVTILCIQWLQYNEIHGSMNLVFL